MNIYNLYIMNIYIYDIYNLCIMNIYIHTNVILHVTMSP